MTLATYLLFGLTLGALFTTIFLWNRANWSTRVALLMLTVFLGMTSFQSVAKDLGLVTKEEGIRVAYDVCKEGCAQDDPNLCEQVCSCMRAEMQSMSDRPSEAELQAVIERVKVVCAP